MPPTQDIDLGGGVSKKRKKPRQSKRYHPLDPNPNPAPLSRSELYEYRLAEEKARNSIYVKIVTQTQWMIATVIVIASISFFVAKYFFTP